LPVARARLPECHRFVRAIFIPRTLSALRQESLSRGIGRKAIAPSRAAPVTLVQMATGPFNQSRLALFVPWLREFAMASMAERGAFLAAWSPTSLVEFETREHSAAAPGI
jgi:hypothetical protein